MCLTPHRYAWDHHSLVSILARMQHHCFDNWMFSSAHTLQEYLSLTRGVLALGVFRGPSDDPFNKLPNEIVDMILLLAAARDRKTRLSLQLGCRRFRCLIVLNFRQYTDLTSLPPFAPAFIDYTLRSFWTNRPFQLIFDEENEAAEEREIPPHPLLLASLNRADVINVQHTLGSDEVMSALTEKQFHPFLEVLRLYDDGGESCLEHELAEDGHSTGPPVIYAPRLHTLHLRHWWADFPASQCLRQLWVDSASQFAPQVTCNAFPTEILYSLLERNQSLSTIYLNDAFSSRDWQLEEVRPRIRLDSLESIDVMTTMTEPAVWLFKRLHLPTNAYIHVDVGRDFDARPDVDAVLNSISHHLVGRQFDTLVVMEAWGCTSVLLSQGTRVWASSARFEHRAFAVPLLLQGDYLPMAGAVDITFHWERPFMPRVYWPDVLDGLVRKCGLSVSSLKCLEVRRLDSLRSPASDPDGHQMKSDFRSCSLGDTLAKSMLPNVEVLRLWPERLAPLQNLVWQLCVPALSDWAEVAASFGRLFPGMRSIVDMRRQDIVYGGSVNELIHSISKYPDHRMG
ncbi:hypothetical protein PENSPDRAFT_669301 [Peniophora sp. CONT]|nr:hypothetical protein PENSPDRAFT_669301 [Peniophora sp. CONT]